MGYKGVSDSPSHTAVIQARMQASRLPGKVLLPVVGRPLLALNIERILLSSCVDRVVVATTDQPADQPLVEFCEREGIPVFRGSEDDVLDRLYRCASTYHLDPLIRFTADNPLVDPEVNDEVIRHYFAEPGLFDYVSNNHPPTWPDGLEVEVVAFSALETAWREADQPFQREHGTPFIWDQPERFRVGNVALPDDHLHAERWTLDFPEDYEFLKRVFEELYPGKPNFLMEDVLQLLDANPDLRTINSDHSGVTWYAQHSGKLRTVASGTEGCVL